MSKPRRRRRIYFEPMPEMRHTRAKRLLTELVPLLRSIRDAHDADPLLRFESQEVLETVGGWLDAVQPEPSRIGRPTHDHA